MARWETTVWSLGVLAQAGLVRPYLPDQVFGMGLAVRRYGLSVAAMYAVGAARSSRRAALVDDAGTLSFGQMDDRTGNVAAGLADRGIHAGDPVGLLARNHRGFVEAMVGLAKLGADGLFLNTGMAGPQLAEVCAREGAAAVIVDEEFRPAAGEDTVPITMSEIDRWAGGRRRQPPPALRSGGQIILTSGTTGTPKGAHRSTPGGLTPLVALLSAIPLRRGDVTHVAAPLFHAWGYAHWALAAAMGSTLVLRRRFDPEATLRLIEEQGVTVLVAVPVMVQRIMDLPEATRAAYDTSSLRVAVVSGSALPGGLATRFMDAFGDILYNLYGSTEVAWVSIASPADLRAAPATAGRPPRGTALRLLDSDEADVKPGARGRIFVGNDLLFSGYTGGGSKPVVAGLMATGDTGHVDHQGLLFVDGRDDDMIVSGGENVFPIEVEELLLEHPAIAEVCVVGVPDAQWGQRLRACVVLALGVDPLTAGQVKDLVRGRLATYKVPRDVVFLDELPRNATGKVLRRQLAGGGLTVGQAAPCARCSARNARREREAAPAPGSGSGWRLRGRRRTARHATNPMPRGGRRARHATNRSPTGRRRVCGPGWRRRTTGRRGRLDRRLWLSRADGRGRRGLGAGLVVGDEADEEDGGGHDQVEDGQPTVAVVEAEGERCRGQQDDGQVVARRVDLEGQDLDHAEGVFGQHADHQDDGADHHAGGDGLVAAADDQGHGDEAEGDGVVGDGVEPGGKKSHERH